MIRMRICGSPLAHDSGLDGFHKGIRAARRKNLAVGSFALLSQYDRCEQARIMREGEGREGPRPVPVSLVQDIQYTLSTNSVWVFVRVGSQGCGWYSTAVGLWWAPPPEASLPLVRQGRSSSRGRRVIARGPASRSQTIPSCCPYQKVHLVAHHDIPSRDLKAARAVGDRAVGAHVVLARLKRRRPGERAATLATFTEGQTAGAGVLSLAAGRGLAIGAPFVRSRPVARRSFRPRAARTDDGDHRPPGLPRWCRRQAA